MVYTLITIIVFILAAIGLFFLYRKLSGNKVARFFVFTVLFSAIAVAAEVFVFNHSFFMSSGYDKFPSETAIEYIKDDNGIKQIKLDFNDTEVKNIYLDCYVEKKKDSNTKTEIQAVSIFYDSANSKGKETSCHPLAETAERSKYINYSLSDKVSHIDIDVSAASKDCTVGVRDVKVNVRVPMMFSWKRALLLFILMFILYNLRPGSGIYQYVLKNRKLSVSSFCVFLFITCAAVFITIKLNDAENSFYLYANQHQYADLAEALSKGDISLGIASEQLRSMDNPYDFGAREEMIKNGMPYVWDKAYYEGNYYVYFGVVPCVLTFLPYHFITGGDLPNFISFTVFAFGFVAAAFFMTELFRKKLAPQMSPLIVHILTSVGAFGSTVYISKYADLYGIPIMAGMMFSVLGILFWILSLGRTWDTDKISKTRKKRSVSIPFIILGSLCMTLVLGSRPQMALLFLLAIPIFWRAVFKDRLLFSRRGIVQTIVFWIPIIAVIIPLMYYNHARFGSFLDFGANYNLTSNDMTARGVEPGRIASALFAYFIEPAELDVRFPFLKASNVRNTLYQGTVISDPMFGGVFAQALLWMLPAVFLKKVRQFMLGKRIFKYFVLLIAFSVIIAVADAQAAGVLERYIADYCFMMYGAAVLIIMSVVNVLQTDQGKEFFSKLLYVLTVFTIIYLFLMTFVSQEPLAGIYNVNSERFYRLFYGISFWV